jgi:hypothetical protein
MKTPSKIEDAFVRKLGRAVAGIPAIPGIGPRVVKTEL